MCSRFLATMSVPSVLPSSAITIQKSSFSSEPFCNSASTHGFRFSDSLHAGMVTTINCYPPACVAISVTPSKMKKTPAQLTTPTGSLRKTLENMSAQMYDVASIGYSTESCPLFNA